MKRWAKALLLLAAMLCLALPALAEADVGRGATGDAVVEIQTRLNQLGYGAGSADGQYGGRTEDAVKQFQKINGLEETGVVDEATRACLFSENALDAAGRSAPADPDVVLVQRQLRLLGVALEITGKCDEATVEALKTYQAAHGLQASGEVSPATLRELGAEIDARAAERLLVSNGDAATPLYGYANAAGEIVIPPQFAWASGVWRNGLVRVTFADGRSGYIDLNGETALVLARLEGEDFSEGVAMVSRDGRVGYIDMNGDFVWPLSENKLSGAMCTAFAGGRARVNDKLIDRFGNTYPTPLDLKDVTSMISTGFCEPFSEGLMCLRKSTPEGRKYGYIDETGATAIPFQFDYAESFSEGLAVVGVGLEPSDMKYGYIDAEGAEAIPCEYSLALPFCEGAAVVRDAKGVWGTLDPAGKFTAAKTQWDAAIDAGYSEGLLAVEADGWVGFVDAAGELVIPSEYLKPEEARDAALTSDRLYAFRNGVCLVYAADGTPLYIDAAGKTLFAANGF